MSDFLSNLVERSLAATDIVRPQLLSIFESPLVNGGAFFRGHENQRPAVQEQNQETADRLSRLRSLWRINSEPATQFVAALSEPGVTSPESAELPSASPEVRPSVDLPRKQQNVAPPRERRESVDVAKTDEEDADTRLEPPAQIRPRVLPGKQQSAALSKERRGTADAAKTDEEDADTFQPELSSASPRVRPRIDLPRKQQSIASSKERRETADAAKTDEEGRGPLRPQSPLPSEHVASTSSTSKSVFRDSGKNLLRERRVEKVVEIITPEREGYLELTQARNVRAVSPRPPSPRPLAPARQPKNPPVEPSINVTIGRVEVRATLPPEPSKTLRASAPILNLDEYLRQRAGGSRR